MSKEQTENKTVKITGGKPVITEAKTEATADQAPSKPKVEMIEHNDGTDLPSVDEVRKQEIKESADPVFENQGKGVEIIERDRESAEDRKERIDEQMKENLPDGVVKENEDIDDIDVPLDNKNTSAKMSTDEALSKLATSSKVNVDFKAMINEGILENPKEVAKILSARGFLIKY